MYRVFEDIQDLLEFENIYIIKELLYLKVWFCIIFVQLKCQDEGWIVNILQILLNHE